MIFETINLHLVVYSIAISVVKGWKALTDGGFSFDSYIVVPLIKIKDTE